ALLDAQHVEAKMKAFHAQGSPYEVRHKVIYRVHQRVASEWRVGRVLLAGDAAHLNNPLGAFALNSRIHDAVNLAEKLGRARPGGPRRKRRGSARPLRAPAPRGLRRAGAGDVDPQQAHARGARPQGAARAHGRARRHRQRPRGGSRLPARELHDLGTAQKRGHRLNICRYDHDRFGLVQDEAVRAVTAVLDELGSFRYPLPGFDPLIGNLERLKPRIESLAKNAKRVPLAEVRLLAPVANPGKVIAAPVNYTKHLQEALADKGIHHDKLVSEIHKAGMFLKATS